MKTTIDIPDEVFRSVEAIAAGRGETLRDFVIRAIETRVRSEGAGQSGWRSVFGRAQAEDVEAVDQVAAADFERIDLAEWR